MARKSAGFRELRGSGFYRLLGAQGFSSAAEYSLESVTKLVVSTALPGALASLGLLAVSILSVLPRALLSKLAGSVADTFDRPRVLLLSAFFRFMLGLCLFGFALLVHGGSPVFACVLIFFAFATSCLSQFFNTARYSLAHSVIPVDSRPEASSLSLFSLTGIGVVVTAFVPALYFWLQFNTVIVIAISCELFAVLLVASKVNTDRPRNVGHAAGPSFARVRGAVFTAFVRKYPVMRLILTVSCVYSLCTGLVNVSLPLFILRYHHIPMHSYGLITASFALGGLVGGGLAWKCIKTLGSGTVLIGTGALLGSGYILFALLWLVPLLSLTMFLIGVSVSCFSVAQGPILQGGVPNSQIGRAYGLINGVSSIFLICGAVLGGLAPFALSRLVSDSFASYSYPLSIGFGGFVVVFTCLFWFWNWRNRLTTLPEPKR